MLTRSTIAPLQRSNTLLQLSRSSISDLHLAPHGRAIHFGTKRKSPDVRVRSEMRGIADMRNSEILCSLIGASPLIEVAA